MLKLTTMDPYFSFYAASVPTGLLLEDLSEPKVLAIPCVTVSQDDFGAPLNIQGTSLGHLPLQTAPLKPCGEIFNLCAC